MITSWRSLRIALRTASVANTICVFLLLGAACVARGQAACDAGIEECWRRGGGGGGGGSSASPAYPTGSSGFHLNPSAVPTSPGYGGEVQYFNGQWDGSLVHGSGRIGEAVSLQNGEERFFGSPSLEVDPEYLDRMQNRKEYHSQKFSLAGAVQLFDNRKSDLRHLQLNLGLQLLYNSVVQQGSLGTGLSAIVGPLTLGVAIAGDPELIHRSQYGLGEDQIAHSTDVTYSLGLYLNQLAIDYSLLEITPEPGYGIKLNPLSVTLFTVSAFVKKFIFTTSLRTERSDRMAYDFATKTLYAEHTKQEVFGGVQYSVTRSVIVGCYYNYYLLREISVGLTIFI